MRVGICVLELRLAGVGSLKEKRRILRSGIDRAKERYNVSIAEVGYQDTWQRATLGVTCVSSQTDHVHRMLTAVVRFIEGMHDAELIDYSIEMI